MARKSMTGQLNMFDLFNNVEPGEVQMVSLMPEDEPEVEKVPEPVVEPEPVIEAEIEPVLEPEPMKVAHTAGKKTADSVMSRIFQIGGQTVEIAYLDYNKVRITKGNNAPEIKEFSSTKEAVDYYVAKMQELISDE